MKFKKSTLAAVIVGSSLGLAASSASANNRIHSRNELPTDRYPTKIEDDSSMAPGVPGVTEENPSGMTADEVRAAQQKLAAEGYDVRSSEGAITNDFRAAVREFQKDNGLVITGSLDSETVALLGINVSRSSG